MIKYGNIRLKVVVGSLSIVKAKKQEVRHYPGTDISVAIEKGRPATTISCTLLAKSETERILLEQMLHNAEENELIIGGHYYKKVVTGESGTPQPIDPDMETWEIEAEFIALDPIPYDIETGEALY